MGTGAPKASLAAKTAASFRGERIGKYEVIAQLSVGGMAELFLAFTSGPGGFRKYAAVKRILPDVRSDEQFIEMFLDEARLTAAFNHPNIAHVFELGEEEDGLYLAMEFVSGQNLNQVSEACRQVGRKVPYGFTAGVMREVCSALDYAYHFKDPSGRALEIIHRDVAQKNVMVAYDGAVKLLDFGIAKAHGSLGRTQVGHVKGTTGYMSPEQVVGGALDARSDVFSVGVVMHELLTGRRLFAGETEEDEMRNILAQPIPRPSRVDPEIPEPLSDLVMRALAREKADRFPDARALAQAIQLGYGGLCFDAERRATLLQERFEGQVAATRTLLDAAGGKTRSSVIARALDVLREGSTEGRTEEKTSPSPPTLFEPPEGPAEPARPAGPTVLSTPGETRARPLAPERRESHLLMWIALSMLVLSAGVISWGLLIFKGGPTLPPGTDPGGGLRPLALASSSDGNDAGTGGARTLAGARSVPGIPTPPLAPRPGPETHHSARRHRREGRLSLVTYPRSEVFEGNHLLGKTPLLGVRLSVGMHHLRLEGSDGQTRMLPVPIRAGKTLPLRIHLSDLPTR